MIRVFIGTDSDVHGDAEKALGYSIRKNTAEEVELTFMNPGWKIAPTGFATHRYLIPQLCNWEGYAIYLDVDMIVLGDLSELMSYKIANKWAIPVRTEEHTGFAGNFRDEVAVIDCSAAKNTLPTEEILKTKDGKKLARAALHDYYAEVIPLTWNAMTVNEEPTPKLIHYTNPRTQPWCPDPKIDYMPFPCNETYDLFFNYLEEANEHIKIY